VAKTFDGESVTYIVKWIVTVEKENKADREKIMRYSAKQKCDTRTAYHPRLSPVKGRQGRNVFVELLLQFGVQLSLFGVVLLFGGSCDKLWQGDDFSNLL